MRYSKSRHIKMVAVVRQGSMTKGETGENLYMFAKSERA
jgi:hypothetical protein